eukprot:236122-Chlamydomonas_euryale.AAC.1
MDGALGAALPAPLARADVWLLRPPSAAVEDAVWAPVCAMALDAIEHGWTVLWARLAGMAATAAALDTGGLAGALQAAVGAAGRLAAARFWSSVKEFAHSAAAVGAFEGLGQTTRSSAAERAAWRRTCRRRRSRWRGRRPSGCRPRPSGADAV